MISAISGYNPSAYGLYGSYYANRTAQTLGILRQSLQYRIRKYGLIF